MKIKALLKGLFVFKHPLCDLSTRSKDYREAVKKHCL